MRISDWSSDVCSSDLDLDIAKADLRQHRHFVADGGNGLEKFHGVFHRHVQHVGDGHALELYFEGSAIVARSVADVAGDLEVRQEVHLDFQQAVALTGSAAEALPIEAEPAGVFEPCRTAGKMGAHTRELGA